jgi:hypothetical protein
MRTVAVRECDYERFGGEIPPNGEFARCTFTLPTYLRHSSLFSEHRSNSVGFSCNCDQSRSPQAIFSAVEIAEQGHLAEAGLT